MAEKDFGQCQEPGCGNPATDEVLVGTMDRSEPIDAPGMHYLGGGGSALTPKHYCKPHADSVRNAAAKR